MDDSVLKFIYDDNQKVEPEWYIPIIPTVLVNGAEGIGTGWSCRIPNYDVREIVGNIQRMLDGEEPQPMVRLVVLMLKLLNCQHMYDIIYTYAVSFYIKGCDGIITITLSYKLF